MTQEEKELLLVDLCARLLYKPKALVNGHLATILGIDENVVIVCIDGNDYKDETVVLADNSDEVKLYLRPMSSMTEKEKKEYKKLGLIVVQNYDGVILPNTNEIDWLNAHYLDYRGLIPKGLALEAPEDMYKH